MTNPLGSFFGRSSFSDRRPGEEGAPEVDPEKIPWNYGSPEDWWENYKARQARAWPWFVLWGVFCCTVVTLPELSAEWVVLLVALAGAGGMAGLVLRRFHRSRASRFITLDLMLHSVDQRTPPKAPAP